MDPGAFGMSELMKTKVPGDRLDGVIGEEEVGDRAPEEESDCHVAIEPEEPQYPVSIQQGEEHQSEDGIAPQRPVAKGVDSIGRKIGNGADQPEHHEDDENEDEPGRR